MVYHDLYLMLRYSVQENSSLKEITSSINQVTKNHWQDYWDQYLYCVKNHWHKIEAIIYTVLRYPYKRYGLPFVFYEFSYLISLFYSKAIPFANHSQVIIGLKNKRKCTFYHFRF